MAKMTTTNKDETADSNVIDTHQKFEMAVIRAQANILSDPDPSIEVSPEFMQALSSGRDLESMTYGRPAVRVFKAGARDRILSEEGMTADEYYNLEVKRKGEAKRK